MSRFFLPRTRRALKPRVIIRVQRWSELDGRGYWAGYMLPFKDEQNAIGPWSVDVRVLKPGNPEDSMCNLCRNPRAALAEGRAWAKSKLNK